MFLFKIKRRVRKKPILIGYFFLATALISMAIILTTCGSETKVLYVNLNPNPIIICFEDEHKSTSGSMDNVISIESYNRTMKTRDRKCRERIKGNTTLTDFEFWRRAECASNYTADEKRDHDLFWTGNNQYIRWLHHGYLTSDSVIIDVGGNVGDDAEALMNNTSPRKYVLLEPMKHMYLLLKKRFENRKYVDIYNFGLGAKNEIFKVNIEGTSGDATSVFKDSKMEGTCSLSVVNTTAFMMKLGVICTDVDLLTINCEGCEFDVLESLVSSSLVNSFKNIQFATHSKMKHLENPVGRYCLLQELLSRTNKLTYQYKFNWESWRRKDLSS